MEDATKSGITPMVGGKERVRFDVDLPPHLLKCFQANVGLMNKHMTINAKVFRKTAEQIQLRLKDKESNQLNDVELIMDDLTALADASKDHTIMLSNLTLLIMRILEVLPQNIKLIK